MKERGTERRREREWARTVEGEKNKEERSKWEEKGGRRRENEEVKERGR